MEGAVLADGAPRDALDAAAAALEACVGRVRIEEAARGDLPGLRSALVAARAPAVLVTRAELPAPEPSHVLALLALVPEQDGSDAVVPLGPEGPDPLFAVYRPRILPVVERCIRDHLDLPRLLDEIDTLFVDKRALHGS